MSVLRIAYNNFKNNIKIYTMFFISMIFSVVILSNFMILLKGNTLDYLGKMNKEYSKMTLQILIVMLTLFMLFFIWYSSNIFLKNRKKEIGIYTFMGLDSFTVGRIYFTEMMLIGLSSCAIGTGIGVLFSKFFQMIVFKMADFNIDIKFNITADSIMYTVATFLIIFIIMALKGFINILRSSVIDLLKDNKKGDKPVKVRFYTYLIAAVSLFFIIYGYYMISNDKTKAFTTLIIVCFGTYGLFGTVLSVIFNFLINRKSILYKGENIITINNLFYRMRKNFTTYATIAIFTACTVTVLGAAVSMKTLYEKQAENNELYSLTFTSNEEIKNQEKIKELFSSIGKVKYSVNDSVLKVNVTEKNSFRTEKEEFIVLSYDQFADILRRNNHQDSISKVTSDMISGNNVVYIPRPMTLGSLVNKSTIVIGDNIFQKGKDDMKLPVIGCAFNTATLIVSNENYKKIEKYGEKNNFLGIKIENDSKLLDKKVMDNLVTGMSKFMNVKQVAITCGIYETDRIAWLKVIYAMMAFLFLVFILAEASIIYIKIYGDANEDKIKYKILKNIGASTKELGKSINKEVAMFYIIPVMVGLIHSYFAVGALGNIISIDLTKTFVISVIVSVVVFFISAVFSSRMFKKIVRV